MPRLLTGIEWLDQLRLHPTMPPGGPLHRTVTVDGDERDATWKKGVGIYVDGFDFGKGDTVLTEGAPHEMVEMRRMQLEGGAVTLIIKARDSSGER